MCQTLLSKRPLLTGFCYVVSVMNKLCFSICTTLLYPSVLQHLPTWQFWKEYMGFLIHIGHLLSFSVGTWSLQECMCNCAVCMNGFLSILIEKRFCTTHFFQWLCTTTVKCVKVSNSFDKCYVFCLYILFWLLPVWCYHPPNFWLNIPSIWKALRKITSLN